MTEAIRTLVPGDESLLEAFLLPRTQSSMFLRSNCLSGGLEDRGEVLQGTYVGAFRAGDLIGVAGHFWNGMLIVQAPEELPALVQAATEQSGRALFGLGGPWAQVCAAREVLGHQNDATSLDSCEDLFAVQLDALELPEALASAELRCRAPHEEELEMLAHWHVDYCAEALGRAPTAEGLSECRSEMQRLQRDQLHFLLTRPSSTSEGSDESLSYCAYNSHLPDCVQIGGVWTPVDLRGHGYARAVVAGSLVAAKERGATQSVLFTGDDNAAARRAYEAIGYRIVGDYGLILFENPRPV